MDERALKSWVSDKLHDILGFAEGAPRIVRHRAG